MYLKHIIFILCVLINTRLQKISEEIFPFFSSAAPQTPRFMRSDWSVRSVTLLAGEFKLSCLSQKPSLNRNISVQKQPLPGQREWSSGVDLKASTQTDTNRSECEQRHLKCDRGVVHVPHILKLCRGSPLILHLHAFSRSIICNLCVKGFITQITDDAVVSLCHFLLTDATLL